MNRFPGDFHGNLTGFGGDPAMNQAQHRAATKKTPVILVHGQGTNATDSKWGWSTMVKFLKAIGYNDCELWAMDYLGEDNNQVDMPNPHTHRIHEFRKFIDLVIAYLGVERVDFIAHSLGCGMVNAYLHGLQPGGTWKDDDGRFEKAGTFVALCGGTYGLGRGSMGEFQTGSAFEQRSHQYKGIADDTPFGADSLTEQDAADESCKQVTSLDNDKVKYVAIIAVNDFVDTQNKDTSRRKGAHLCRRFNLGDGLAGHEKVIKDQTVFDIFKKYLNSSGPRVTILVDKASGNYGSNLQITISVKPADTAVKYDAERLTKTAFEAGYIRRYVAETRSGPHADGQAITLAPDGAWEVTWSAPGAEKVVRTYGVNVVLPIATILTGEDEPWVNNSLTVMASTTKGILYHSLDAEHWIEGATVPITEAAIVSFMAIDADGLPSPPVSRRYEPPIRYKDKVKATPTEHLIAGRLTSDQYLALGRELGFTAVITLYLIDDKWVYDPNMPERGVAAPTGLLSMALEARGVKPREAQLVITADKDPHREYPEGFEVRLSASDPNGNPVPVYYTEDGSDPADARNPNRHRFVGSQSFKISRSGNHAIFCYARDSSGNERFEPFTWSIQEKPK